MANQTSAFNAKDGGSAVSVGGSAFLQIGKTALHGGGAKLRSEVSHHHFLDFAKQNLSYAFNGFQAHITGKAVRDKHVEFTGKNIGSFAIPGKFRNLTLKQFEGFLSHF